MFGLQILPCSAGKLLFTVNCRVYAGTCCKSTVVWPPFAWVHWSTPWTYRVTNKSRQNPDVDTAVPCHELNCVFQEQEVETRHQLDLTEIVHHLLDLSEWDRFHHRIMEETQQYNSELEACKETMVELSEKFGEALVGKDAHLTTTDKYHLPPPSALSSPVTYHQEKN